MASGQVENFAINLYHPVIYTISMKCNAMRNFTCWYCSYVDVEIKKYVDKIIKVPFERDFEN